MVTSYDVLGDMIVYRTCLLFVVIVVLPQAAMVYSTTTFLSVRAPNQLFFLLLFHLLNYYHNRHRRCHYCYCHHHRHRNRHRHHDRYCYRHHHHHRHHYHLLFFFFFIFILMFLNHMSQPNSKRYFLGFPPQHHGGCVDLLVMSRTNVYLRHFTKLNCLFCCRKVFSQA